MGRRKRIRGATCRAQSADRGQGPDRGQSIVELALVLVVLVILLAGAVDFGNVFRHYIIITNAAREGARYASHFPHFAPGIREATIDEAENGGVVLVDTDILIAPEPPVDALPDNINVAQPGESIIVSVEFDVPMTVSGIIGLSTVTIRTRTEMVVFGLDKM